MRVNFIKCFSASCRLLLPYLFTKNVKLKNLNPLEITEQSKNINDQPLEICSINPKTGFYRDGYCNTGENDYGTHTVCAKMTKEFLDYTKSKGNDLSTPSPELNFPGLKLDFFIYN